MKVRKLLPPIAVLLSIVCMILLDKWLPIQHVLLPPWTDVGIVFILIGLYTVFSTSRLIKNLDTEIHTFKNPRLLITTNLFAFSRNPIYLGFTSLLLGIAICLGSLSPFLLAVNFFCLANFWYIPFEEKKMESTFGDKYNNYKKKVRRWL